MTVCNEVHYGQLHHYHHEVAAEGRGYWRAWGGRGRKGYTQLKKCTNFFLVSLASSKTFLCGGQLVPFLEMCGVWSWGKVASNYSGLHPIS